MKAACKHLKHVYRPLVYQVNHLMVRMVVDCRKTVLKVVSNKQALDGEKLESNLIDTPMSRTIS